MTATRRHRNARPFWERAYKAHGYWAGKRKVGSVRLREGAPAEEKYSWQAGTHAGVAATLNDAKRAVEAAVLLGVSQMTLFQDDDAT